jgi:seryl-tRNA synthetase
MGPRELRSRRRRTGISAGARHHRLRAGTKIAGARFSVLMGAGPGWRGRCINFMLQLHTASTVTPRSSRRSWRTRASLTGTGNLPKFEADLFKIAGEWDSVPDAHGGGAADEPASRRDPRRPQLPIRYTAYTPCFRSEAARTAPTCAD